MTQQDYNSFLPIIGEIMTRLGDPQLAEEKKDIVLEKLNDILADLNNHKRGSGRHEHSEITETIDKSISENSSNPLDEDESLDNIEIDNNNNLSDQLLSDELQKHVLDIKSGIVPPKADSEKLIMSIEEHDTVRIIGHVTNDGLWNGEYGWHTADTFYSMASYIWAKARALFVELDFDRKIIEDKTTWNQAYFNDQRNYLRHNFSLERLCHMIMVYDFLHGNQANVEKPSTKPKAILKKDSRNPFDVDSADVPAVTHDSQSHCSKRILLVGILLIVAIVIFCIIFCFSVISSQETPSTERHGQDKQTNITSSPIKNKTQYPSQESIYDIQDVSTEKVDLNNPTENRHE